METFKVIIEPTAEYDLNSIVEYIAIALGEKEIAFKLYRKLKDGIISLTISPGRCAIVDEKRLKAMEVRMLLVDNYSVFYYINKESKAVHILRVIYSRRDWKNLILNQ